MISKDAIPQVDQIKEGPDEFDVKAVAGWEEISDHRDRGKLNPLMGMMKRPTATLRELYRLEYPVLWPLLLVVVSGIAYSLNQFVLATDLSLSAFVQTVLLGGISSLLLAVLNSAAINFFGRKLGGAGTFKRVLIAWGWSSAPSFFILIIWGLRFAIVGPTFLDGGPMPDTEQGLGIRSLIYLTIASIVLMLWQAIVTVKSIAIAHEFGILRALVSTLVLPLFIVVAMALIP